MNKSAFLRRFAILSLIMPAWSIPACKYSSLRSSFYDAVRDGDLPKVNRRNAIYGR
jgi:hypothetical protein